MEQDFTPNNDFNEAIDNFDNEFLHNYVRMSSTEYLKTFVDLVEKMPFYQRTKTALNALVNELFSSANFYGYNKDLELALLYIEEQLLMLYPAVAKSDAKSAAFVALQSLIKKHSRIIATRTIGNSRERVLQNGNDRTIRTIQEFGNSEEDRKSKRGWHLGRIGRGE